MRPSAGHLTFPLRNGRVRFYGWVGLCYVRMGPVSSSSLSPFDETMFPTSVSAGYPAICSSVASVCHTFLLPLSTLITSACGVIYTVILIYDHALTLGSEVGLIWQRRLRRPSAIWFLVVRYIPLACSCVMLVFHFGNLSPEVRCSYASVEGL
jgi:hypothetical protein